VSKIGDINTPWVKHLEKQGLLRRLRVGRRYGGEFRILGAFLGIFEKSLRFNMYINIH